MKSLTFYGPWEIEVVKTENVPDPLDWRVNAPAAVHPISPPVGTRIQIDEPGEWVLKVEFSSARLEERHFAAVEVSSSFSYDAAVGMLATVQTVNHLAAVRLVPRDPILGPRSPNPFDFSLPHG